MRENAWISIFVIYCLIAVFWSDIPFVAAKRWFKTLGHPVMALIILTDPNPLGAFRTIMKRCAYILLPLSVLFIKYLPQYGRGFDEWTGSAVNRGINLNKNELGYVCLVFGLFFIWNFLNQPSSAERRRPSERTISAFFLVIDLWLLYKASSATAAVALFVGSFCILLLQLPKLRARDLRIVVVLALVAAAVVELSFNVDAPLISLLGRNETLTDRTAVWHDALSLSNSPIFGTGFESFWSGKRLELLWAKWWWHPNQAHDGYIETYLNLGFVGVAALLGMILATFLKITRRINGPDTFARFRMGFLFAVVVYNFTEATFKGVALVWTIFNLIAIDPPEVAQESVPMSADQMEELSDEVEEREFGTTIEA
ncbi:MAG TPA: O-antigen ligase family protein [Opitutaceae bacterium]|jgi:O-antigen ligase